MVVKFAIILLVLIEFFLEIFKFIIEEFTVIAGRSLLVICKSIEIVIWLFLLVEVQSIQVALWLAILFLFVVVEIAVDVPLLIAVVVIVSSFVFGCSLSDLAVQAHVQLWREAAASWLSLSGRLGHLCALGHAWGLS